MNRHLQTGGQEGSGAWSSSRPAHGSAGFPKGKHTSGQHPEAGWREGRRPAATPFAGLLRCRIRERQASQTIVRRSGCPRLIQPGCKLGLCRERGREAAFLGKRHPGMACQSAENFVIAQGSQGAAVQISLPLRCAVFSSSKVRRLASLILTVFWILIIFEQGNFTEEAG